MNRRKSFFPDQDLDRRVQHAVHAFRRAAFTQGIALKHHPVRGGKPASLASTPRLGNA